MTVKRRVLFFSILSVAGALHADLPDAVLEDPAVQGILAKPCLHIEASGTAEADFAALLAVNARDDLLDAVQREYAAMLPEGEEPEFEVEEIAPGHYFYVNCKQQESQVTEVLRGLQPDGNLHAVYTIAAERFFGRFEALVHVRISDAAPGKVHYAAEVYAWPENTFARLFARGMHFAIESFFRRETRCMTSLVLDLCARLVDEPAAEPGIASGVTRHRLACVTPFRRFPAGEHLQ